MTQRKSTTTASAAAAVHPSSRGMGRSSPWTSLPLGFFLSFVLVFLALFQVLHASSAPSAAMGGLTSSELVEANIAAAPPSNFYACAVGFANMAFGSFSLFLSPKLINQDQSLQSKLMRL